MKGFKFYLQLKLTQIYEHVGILSTMIPSAICICPGLSLFQSTSHLRNSNQTSKSVSCLCLLSVNKVTPIYRRVALEISNERKRF